MKKTILMIALILCCCAATVRSQSGTVTFYAPGSMWSAVAKGEATAGIGARAIPFQGWIFVDGENVAHMRARHFVVFRIPAGTHSLSASWNKGRPSDKATLDLRVEPNGHYFVQLDGEQSGALIVQVMKSGLASVTCNSAFNVASGFPALAAHAVSKSAREQLVDSIYFPKCDQLEAESQTAAAQ